MDFFQTHLELAGNELEPWLRVQCLSNCSNCLQNTFFSRGFCQCFCRHGRRRQIRLCFRLELGTVRQRRPPQRAGLHVKICIAHTDVALTVRESQGLFLGGPEDSIESEMIKQLPQEDIFKITRSFQDRFVELEEALSSWNIVKLVFLWKTDVEPKRGIISYRAIVLTSVMSRWYVTRIVLRFEKRKRARRLEAVARGWFGRYQWSASSTTDDAVASETLGGTGR